MLKSAQDKSVHNKTAQEKSGNDLPLSGYAVVVDGQTEFKTKDGAHNGAHDLKRRFPMLQIKVYDAETKQTHDIELARA